MNHKYRQTAALVAAVGVMAFTVVTLNCMTPAPAQQIVAAVAPDSPATGVTAPDLPEHRPPQTSTTVTPETITAPTTTTTKVPPKKAPTTPKVYKAPSVPAPTSGSSRWDQLAQCESGGNWAHPPVGSYGYSGGTMTLPSTWRAYGGLAFAPAAYQATKAQQIIVNERVLADAGWKAWPGCSKKFGWR